VKIVNKKKKRRKNMKKAIIIGATSGIGKELAKLLTEDGYLVGITGRRTELLTEIQKQNPKLYRIRDFDITEIEKIETKLNELTEEIGEIDLLILSSGIGDINAELNFEIEKRTIETNVLGFTCVSDWAFNYFEKQKSGHLVAISSIAGIRGSRQATSYNATKAYQINYLEGLRQKAKNLKMKIFITDIRPGFVNTEMAKGKGLFWVASVEKASKQIYNAILKKTKIVYVTKRWGIIASILKRIPDIIYDKM
jgi:short-subunit dehydrogenase